MLKIILWNREGCWRYLRSEYVEITKAYFGECQYYKRSVDIIGGAKKSVDIILNSVNNIEESVNITRNCVDIIAESVEIE